MNQPDEMTGHEFIEEFVDDSMNDSMDESIDESMMSLSDMVEDLVEPFEPEQDEHKFLSMSLESIHLDMPVQLQVVVLDGGKVKLGITPPLYKIETSFEPVFHQIKFTCAIDE